LLQQLDNYYSLQIFKVHCIGTDLTVSSTAFWYK